MRTTVSKESLNNYRRTLYFVLFLYIVWIGAWLLERALEPEIGWITTNGGQFTYWTIMTVLLWLLPSIALIHGLGYRVREVIAFNRWRSAILWGCSAGFILILIKLIINAYNHQPLFSLPVKWSFATSVIVAPIVEEITFRGAVLRGLRLCFVTADINPTGSLLPSYQSGRTRLQARLADRVYFHPVPPWR